MQSLASYSFEAAIADPGQRLRDIDELVDGWLIQKGADDPRGAYGSFESLTGGGSGAFERKRYQSTGGIATEVELIETAHTGATFTTVLQVTSVGDTVSVFASLSATPGASMVAPVRIYPRCPWIVRNLIVKFGDWRFAGQPLPQSRAFDASTVDGVKHLCSAIRDSSRRLPIVVVSVDVDEQVWPDLAARAAEHLVGLADVAFVDAESSWNLTDVLGTRDSCFLGAVRLYWPLRRADGGHEGIVWLPNRMKSFGSDDQGRNRFLSMVRQTVMSTAALTMVQPSSFRAIQSAEAKERLQAMASAEREAQLSSIVDENARLTDALEAAKNTISALQWKVAFFARDEAAEGDKGEEPVEPELERKPPESGETRYYKKIGSGGGIDTLRETGDCNHKSGNWRPAFKGDQAEKGLIKLESRSDWKSLAHCSACTGGGRWRVNW